MQVSVRDKEGAVTGISAAEAQLLCVELPTAARRVGSSVVFTPTRAALDELVSRGGKFDPACRVAWAHFYKPRTPARQPIDFDFKRAPMAHQLEDFHRFRHSTHCAIEWEMGGGKTWFALAIAADLYARGKIDALVVLAPEGVHSAWVRVEAPKDVSVDWVGASWTPSRVRGGMDAVTKDCDKLKIATVNFEALIYAKANGWYKAFCGDNKFLFVIDESHRVKTPSAKSTKAAMALAKHKNCVSRITMTGTPLTRAPTDLWAPYTILDPKILNCNYWQFEKRYTVKQPMHGIKDRRGNPVKKVVGYKNLEQLKTTLDPHRSRRVKADMLDLPPKSYVPHYFKLPQPYHDALAKLKRDLILEFEIDGSDDVQRVEAQLAIVLQTRVLQILSGFYKTHTNEIIPVTKTNPRLDNVMSYAEQISGQGIFYTRFRYSAEILTAALREAFGANEIAAFTHETPKDKLPDLIDGFQAGGYRFIVGNIQRLGTGYTLTAAEHVSYYESLVRYELRKQSEDRAHRAGQTKNVTISDHWALGTPEDNERRNNLLRKHEYSAIVTGDDLVAWLTT